MQPEDPDDRSRPGRDYPAPDRTRQEAQLRLILEDEYLGSRVEPGPLTWRETGIEYFVRRDVLLVEDDHTDRVRDALRRRDRLPIEGAEYPDDLPADNDLEYGVRWIRLRRDSGVMEAMRDLVEEHGDEIADRVGPEFALHIANTGGCCPADEPTPGGRRDTARPADVRRPGGRHRDQGGRHRHRVRSGRRRAAVDAGRHRRAGSGRERRRPCRRTRVTAPSSPA